MSNKIRPFLMFEGNAEEAMNLYMSLFENSVVENVVKYPADHESMAGKIMHAIFTLNGNSYMCIDSLPGLHDFTFTPSFSLFVECDSEAELDKLFAELSKDGNQMMPLGSYGFSTKFGWTADRFGVSWQINFNAK